MKFLFLQEYWMKKLLICLLISSCFLGGFSFGLKGFTLEEPIWTQEHNQVIKVDWISATGSIRDGMHGMIKTPEDAETSSEVGGVIAKRIDTHSGALESTIKLLQTVINYALGLLAFIALVYLIYHGFLMLSAAGNDKQFDQGKSGIKTATIALIGIGMSWLIVSLILWLITQIAS